MPHMMPVIAQIAFCAPFRSLRANRLIHIRIAAIGCKKTDSRISRSTFTFVATAARSEKLRERAAFDVEGGAGEELARGRIVADEERRYVDLLQLGS